ncbi:alanyl-trna synthase [Lasius niger]|uniref:Alanyl-trna synthase n=1 Tax=Lasius niger TaxID=67767 RepID=A0A0J7KHK0_LASNI|nr:alanyl-trna synthase [Lasius niger]
MTKQHIDKNVPSQGSSNPPVAGVEGVSFAPSPSLFYERLAGAFPACVPSFLASVETKEDLEGLERDASPAPSAVPSIPSSLVDTAACLTASEKDLMKRKKKSPLLMLDTSEEELESPELRDKRDRAIADELRNIKEMTTTSLATLLISWINECEGVRQISTNFKDELSGKLRDRLTRMQIGVTVLGNKAAPAYNVASLKIDNDILHIKLEELQKQNDDLREEMKKLKCSIEHLTATSSMANNMAHYTTQTSPPVSPLPLRGKLLPQREHKKTQSQSTSKSMERLPPVRRPPIKGQVTLLTDSPASLLPAAELIPPGRPKEDVLD